MVQFSWLYLNGINIIRIIIINIMDNIKTSDGSIPNCIDFNSCKIISWFSIPKSPPMASTQRSKLKNQRLFYTRFQSLLLRYQLICIKVQWLKSFIFKTSQYWFLKYMMDLEIHKVTNSRFRFAKYRCNP